MGRTPNSAKPLDVRERSAHLYLASESLEWRVHMAVAGQVLETVLVTAPGFDNAERVARAFARKEFRPDKYLVERLQVCAGDGCENIITHHDPRYSRGKGAPTIHDVLEAESRCVSCGPPKP